MLKYIFIFSFIASVVACTSNKTADQETMIIIEPKPEAVNEVEEDTIDYSNWDCDSILKNFYDPDHFHYSSKYCFTDYYRCLNWSENGKYDSVISVFENLWDLYNERGMLIAVLKDPNDERWWGDCLLLDKDLNLLYTSSRIIRFFNDYTFVTDDESVRYEYFNLEHERKIMRYIDTQYLMINKKGELISDQKYFEPAHINNGYFKAGIVDYVTDTIGGLRFGVLDSLRNIAIPFKYTGIITDSKMPEVLVFNHIAKNRYKWGRLNYKNELVVPFKIGAKEDLDLAIEMFED